MYRISEPDWIIFKRHHLIVHETFVRGVLADFRRLMHDESMTDIERFQSITQVVQKAQKKENALFLDYRRSTAIRFIRSFRVEKLLSEYQMAEYSEELREFLRV